ncbi:MAG: toll/interleukin-1 receptor domain-containing protein [Candidatus Rokuibacteriota bacterium]
MSEPSVPLARRIFLSHSRRDAPQVDRIVAALERAGHNVWVDRSVRSPCSWTSAILPATTWTFRSCRRCASSLGPASSACS